MPIFALPIAEIAQLVEHDLAKVGVASSSLVLLFLGLAAPFSLLWRVRVVDDDAPDV